MAFKEGVDKYVIDTQGFEGVEFTQSSRKFSNWLKAVKFTTEQNATLQSAREAAAFRIQAKGKDSANQDQYTRTSAVYFKDNGKTYVVFDDTSDLEQNIILARVQEGFDTHSNLDELLVSKKDKCLSQILVRAERSNRIVEVEYARELATAVNSGRSEFGSNKIMHALFGDIAEPYAALLRSRKLDWGCVYAQTDDDFGKQVGAQNALIKPVGLGTGLGKDGFNGINYISAINNFSHFYGHARGVRNPSEFRQ